LPRELRSSLGHELRLIAPGKLVMGSPRADTGKRANEVRRAVYLQRPFYIGVKEVSNRDFKIFNVRHESATEKFADLGPWIIPWSC
jgi:formylglycine-generating enzyme required for sulfatase activity